MSSPERDISAETALRAVDPLKAYVADIGRYALLTREDEQRIGATMEKGHDAQTYLDEMDNVMPEDVRGFYAHQAERGNAAAEELYTANLRLVMRYARMYKARTKRMDYLDLIQEGNLGLMEAVKGFDYRKGFKFSTYASNWITQAITRGIGDQDKLIRLPNYLETRITSLRQREAEVRSARGDDAEVAPAELSTLGFTEGEVVELRTYADMEPASLDYKLGDDNNSDSLGDIVVPLSAAQNGESVFRYAALQDIQKIFDAAQLDGMERQIILLDYNLIPEGAALTKQEVAAQFGITRDKLRAIQRKAENKLQKVAPQFRSQSSVLLEGGV